MINEQHDVQETVENTTTNNQVICNTETTQDETTTQNKPAVNTANYMHSFPTIHQGLVNQ